MPSKKQRLHGKDVAYLLRRGKKIYGKHFVFCVSNQLRGRAYHQRSVQIPVKLDKRATMRNLLKRVANEEAEKVFATYRIPESKLFCFLNKKELQPLLELIASHQKTDILATRRDICAHDFTLFARRRGKLS